jgi:hypothetical protein
MRFDVQRGGGRGRRRLQDLTQRKIIDELPDLREEDIRYALACTPLNAMTNSNQQHATR